MAVKKKGNIFLRLIFILNIFIAALLLISYLSSYISPAKFWPIAFLGISYPFILLANLIFVVFWIIVRRKYALLSGIAITIGIFSILKLVQFSRHTDVSDLTGTTKVISFNVRNFDIYNYGKNWSYHFEKKNQIFKFLQDEQPDILCFQEYVYDTTHEFTTTDSLKIILNAKNTHIFSTSNNRKLNYFGIATYTTYPIIDTGSIAYNTVYGNICIYTDVLISTDTVRIYNAHFESIRMSAEDYVFAENQLGNSEEKKTANKDITVKEGSERILKRLKKAFVIRASQSEDVAAHIRKCRYPVILCGDFNDTPTSYAYHQVASVLDDAFTESGNGIGQTYAGIFPSFRIDYIMHSKEFESYNFETVYEEMSDHYPVKCYLGLDSKKN